MKKAADIHFQNISGFSLIASMLFVITRVLRGDGEPSCAVTINHKAVACRNVQPRERGTSGIVAGGADGIARAVHLCREGHVAKSRAADGYAGDGCRDGDSLASPRCEMPRYSSSSFSTSPGWVG